MQASTEFDFADLQGIVRFGHGRLSAACLSLLEIRDVAAARALLAEAPVSSAATRSPPPATALQIAFTAKGLCRLELAETTLRQFSDEFLVGMHAPDRARHLGDTDANAPVHWRWGGSELFTRAFTVQQQLTSNHEVLTEPFGFADGISQPSIAGCVTRPPTSTGATAIPICWRSAKWCSATRMNMVNTPRGRCWHRHRTRARACCPPPRTSQVSTILAATAAIWC